MSENTEDKTTEEQEIPTENQETPNVENPVGDEAVSNEEIEKELEEFAAELSEEEKVKQELEQWKDKAIRATADLENFRKRMARDKADSIRFGNQSLLSALLPVIDNFNMGMMAAEQDSGSMIFMGMQMVQKQLIDFLGEQGVTELTINKGDSFDPNLHEAISQEENEEVADGGVIRVMRKGYMMGDRLLRPANVVVSGKEAEEEPVVEVSATSEESKSEE